MSTRGIKRTREDNGQGEQTNQDKRPVTDDLDDEDAPLAGNYKLGKGIRKGHECPYLDSISRQASAVLYLTCF